ncbi:M36 family metallopeptidase [Kribbella catacumbae]|uniref:M36 family metallopeptidase n=1 Tax=Kribbella catacumbae TaxID=460086 RepID=UPI00036791BB|nr:M36 family metallopeptidase [Kribbella catacumbae]
MPRFLRSSSRARGLLALACASAIAVLAAPTAVLGAVPPSGASVAAADPDHGDLDLRAGSVQPSDTQRRAVADLEASVQWNRFGTPESLIRSSGFLATGVAGNNAVTAARSWVDDNRALFRLGSLDGLKLYAHAPLRGSDGHAVHFRQEYPGRPAAEGGQLTVGLVGSPQKGWNIAYVSSSITGDTALAAAQKLSATEAWLAAARNAGVDASAADLGTAKRDREWTVFAVDGLADVQRARPVAVPTYTNGVRPAWQALVVDNQGGHAEAFSTFIDAATGDVIVRRNLVHQSHQPADQFSGAVPQTDGACDTDKGPWVVAQDERIGSVAVSVEATLTTNDSVIHLIRDGQVVASQDTVFSPEALVYDPADGGQGTYHVRICDFGDGAAWMTPNSYTGQIAFNPADAGVPFPPKWKVFPANPLLGNQQHPWNYPSTDTREIWCWDSTVGNPPVTLPECDREVQNTASRAPWDFNLRTNTPTFTTSGNNANSAEAWSSPLTPGPTGFRPFSPQREYVFGWSNAWHTSNCFTPFVPGQSHDIAAATTNLFGMHNRMHDWSYFLGFTEERWNAQDSNSGTGGTADRDPLLGDAQAGALTGGFPSYLGRDNANMITLPDGVPPITNMYLWQPLAGAFYAPCVDGDYDMAVIGHEYGHLIENRMIGKGGSRGGHHAGAMGESFGDFDAAEYLNEYGFVPVNGENPFAVGAYVTGNKERAIRNYGMNFPRTGAFPAPGLSPRVNPLNFSDMGHDIVGQQVHANGEIWSAVNFDIRQALVAKYNGTFPAGDKQLQQACADGKRPAELCPGNRRWIQIVYDAMVLMPTAPSMLQARDAYLAADLMRFGGANSNELWSSFARRGFGPQAFSTNESAEGAGGDTDPTPDFGSPQHQNATVTFRAVDAADKKQEVKTRFYVGHYEARVSPVADTDPATTSPRAGVANNLDEVARFMPGRYEFVANAPGYGHVRFALDLAAGANQTVTVAMPANTASSAKGAVAFGDGVNHANLIDDTEATSWDRTGAQPDVRGSTVTVDLAAGAQTFNRVQVSALLFGQNRFTALRQFEIWACNAAVQNCIAPTVGFAKIYTSPADAFPGFNPRPVAPEMILRSFAVPQTTATHVQIRVLTNQCTGSTAFQGSQDADPLNGTDCREGSPGAGPVTVFGDLPQVLAPRDNEVHIADLQILRGAVSVTTQKTQQ